MPKLHLGALLAVAISATALAQPAVIDLRAKPQLFSATDYQQMLSCSLQNHPDETRRYATYHLVRRDVQTPEQNEADPDSRLMMPALKGCIELKNGEMFPFSLDRLISDWGRAHNVSLPAQQPKIETTEELAVCAMKHNPQTVAKLLAEPRPAGVIMNMGGLFGSRCSPIQNFNLNIDQLYSKLDQLTAEQASRKTAL